MRNGKTMTFRVNGLDSESTRFDGTPGSVRVAASGYGDEVSFRTDAKSAPAKIGRASCRERVEAIV